MLILAPQKMSNLATSIWPNVRNGSGTEVRASSGTSAVLPIADVDDSMSGVGFEADLNQVSPVQPKLANCRHHTTAADFEFISAVAYLWFGVGSAKQELKPTTRIVQCNL